MLSMTRRDETLVAAAFEALGGAARARQLLRRVAEMGFAGKKTQQRLWLQRWRRLAAHRAALRLRQEYLLSRTTWYARQAILSHWAAAATSRPQLRRALARYCTSLCARGSCTSSTRRGATTRAAAASGGGSRARRAWCCRWRAASPSGACSPLARRRRACSPRRATPTASAPCAGALPTGCPPTTVQPTGCPRAGMPSLRT